MESIGFYQHNQISKLKISEIILRHGIVKHITRLQIITEKDVGPMVFGEEIKH